MKAIIKNKKNLFPFIITIIHFSLGFIGDKYIFDFSNLNYTNYALCKVLYFFMLLFLWTSLFKLIKKKSRFLKFLLIYLLITIILFVFLCPGSWFGNDLNDLFKYSSTCNFFYHLNYLTSLFYILGFMLVPCTEGPIILQILLFSITFGYCLDRLYEKYKSKWCFLGVIPFILPHTLFYVYYVNRPVIFGLFYLLIISILLIDNLEKKKLTKGKFLALLFLTTIASNIRSEAIYLVLAIPFIMLFSYQMNKKWKSFIIISLLFVVSYFVVSIPQRVYENSQKIEDVPSSRNLPTYISPLSWMMTYNDFKASEEKLEMIDKVLNVEAMKKWPSYNDVPCMWMEKDCIRNYTKQDYEDFKQAYVDVIMNNKKLFIKAKLVTFSSASSIKGDFFTTYDLYTKKGEYILGRKDTKTIVDYKIRSEIYKIIEGKTKSNLYNKIYDSVCNVLIPLAFTLITCIYSLIKRKWPLFLVCGMLIGHAFIVLISAPAAYFMYYFNLYLSGWYLFGIALLEFLNSFKKVNK